MDERPDAERIGEGYAFGQLARAFATARAHPDADTRRRAEARADRWASVLRGMASGTLRVGSRTPVAGLPAWVTPEVVRGGFATGAAAAGGALTDHEAATARRAGLPARRDAVFGHLLSEAGLLELDGLLTSGA